jgi:hypothetical protein
MKLINAHRYTVPLRTNSITIYSAPRLSRKDADIYRTLSSKPALYLYVIQCTV